MNASFGASWSTVAGVVALTAAMYGSVLIGTRVAGRRTLAELSAYDVLVTIALGTLLGSTAISESVSYAQGAAAVMTLLALQLLVGFVRRVWPPSRRVIDFRPVTVVEGGRPTLPGAMLGPQMTADDLQGQLRLNGVFDVSQVRRAVLEPVGGLSVDRGGRAVAIRSTREVLEAHLRRRRNGDLEGDLGENYSADVVLLSAEGVHHGPDGVRRLASVLRSYVSHGSFRYGQLLVQGDVGMLPWSADGEDVRVHDGADSYIVRDGRIVVQAIHYSTDRST